MVRAVGEDLAVAAPLVLGTGRKEERPRIRLARIFWPEEFLSLRKNKKRRTQEFADYARNPFGPGDVEDSRRWT